MLILYNILQLVFLPVFLPFIIMFILISPKYRDRIPARLGFGLSQKIATHSNHRRGNSSPTFWLHALSVGEVTSAGPLAAALRKKYPDSRIIISVTTRAGKRVAEAKFSAIADHIIDGPLDLLPVIARFVGLIRPDLFILTETDFWPNMLLFLKARAVPTILVNGRVSQKSMTGYQRLRFFFEPMFHSFSMLCLQTQFDREQMEKFGLPSEKLYTLGNLKLDPPTVQADAPFTAPAGLLAEGRVILVCGSTHKGEENTLLDCYCQLRTEHPELFLIIAPRDIQRSAEIMTLATRRGLKSAFRSGNFCLEKEVLILDTIGELNYFYALADISFIGGSLVEQRGHNPIEPAIAGLPVIFGRNMQDFREIANDLIRVGGATEVSGCKDLVETLSTLLTAPQLRETQGRAAQQWVKSQRGATDKHLELISRLL